MKKGGALELSMSTIIIIIIGVTILALGLVWVRTVFTKVGGLSAEAFEKAERVLGEEEEFVGVISAPSSITLKKGDAKILVINVKNIGTSPTTFTISGVSREGGSLQSDCLSSLSLTRSTTSLEVGHVGELTVGFQSKSTCRSGQDFFNIRISGPGSPTHDLIVHVE